MAVTVAVTVAVTGGKRRPQTTAHTTTAVAVKGGRRPAPRGTALRRERQAAAGTVLGTAVMTATTWPPSGPQLRTPQWLRTEARARQAAARTAVGTLNQACPRTGRSREAVAAARRTGTSSPQGHRRVEGARPGGRSLLGPRLLQGRSWEATDKLGRVSSLAMKRRPSPHQKTSPSTDKSRRRTDV